MVMAIIMMVAMVTCVDASGQTLQNASGDSDVQARPSRNHSSDIGDATNTWLNLQRSNTAAAPALPMPGAQATLAYERYMDSFRTRIPASFGSTLSGGSNGGQGGYTNVGAAQPAGAN
jgi:hypothetical protein